MRASRETASRIAVTDRYRRVVLDGLDELHARQRMSVTGSETNKGQRELSLIRAMEGRAGDLSSTSGLVGGCDVTRRSAGADAEERSLARWLGWARQ